VEARGIDISGHNGSFKKDPLAFQKAKAVDFAATCREQLGYAPGFYTYASYLVA